jgi:phosphate starvation-inducible PhoH-like protein
MYASKEISKIILTRPNISVGKDLGFFPGTLEEKFAPWAAPVLDVLNEQLGKGVVETGIKNGNIEMAPLSTMRGRSFKDSFIILDEAQNTTVAEIKMFLTRIGRDCKVVINGDIKQSDISGQSGLAKIIHLAKKHSMSVPVIEFGVEDIVRSDICKQWIIAFEGEGL